MDPAEELYEIVVRSGTGLLEQRAKTIINIARNEGPIEVRTLSDDALMVAIESAQLKINNDISEKSRQGYHQALHRLTGSSYQSVILPNDLTIEDVFIPLTVSQGCCDKEEVFSVDEVLAQGHAQIMIKGLPGAGKTTLLRKIARNCLEDYAAIGLDQSYLPLLIQLQAIGQAHGDDEAMILHALASHGQDLYGTDWLPPSGFLRTWPKKARAEWLFLLDGYDEILESERSHVDSWLRAQIKGGRRIVMMTRPTSNMPSDVENLFRIYDIQGLDNVQQLELAQRLVGDKAESLIQQLEGMELGDLAGTPLLLTVAAIVMDEESGQLPRSRVDLYALFFRKWRQEENARFRGQLGFADLPAELLIDFPEWLARWTSDSPTTATPRIKTEYARHLVQGKGMSASRAEAIADNVVDYQSRRSGLFVIQGGLCTWTHPTFREYLVASSLGWSRIDSEEVATALAKWFDDRWRQVGLMLLRVLAQRNPETDLTLLVEPIIEQNYPFGIIFVLTAYVEGVPIERSQVESCVDRLSLHLSNRARHNLCARLLSRNEGEYDGHRLFRRLSDKQRFGNLADCYLMRLDAIARNADSVTESKECQRLAAFSDLQDVGAEQVLREIALDDSLILPVRFAAYSHLDDTTDLGSVLEETVQSLDQMDEQDVDSPLMLCCKNNQLKPIFDILEAGWHQYSEKALAALYNTDKGDELKRVAHRTENSPWVRVPAFGYWLALEGSNEPSVWNEFLALVLESEEWDDERAEQVLQVNGEHGNIDFLLFMATSKLPAHSSFAAKAVEKLLSLGNHDLILGRLNDPDLSIDVVAGILLQIALHGADDICVPALTRSQELVSRYSSHPRLIRATIELLYRNDLGSDTEVQINLLNGLLEHRADIEWCYTSRGILTRDTQTYLATADFETAKSLGVTGRTFGFSGIHYASIGDNASAIRDLDAAIEQSQVTIEIVRNLLSSLLNTGQVFRALDVASKHGWVASSGELHSTWARIHLCVGEVDEALRLYDEQETYGYLDPFALMHKSYALRIAGRFEEALKALENATPPPNDYTDVLSARVELASHLKDLRTGRAQLDRLAKAHPDFVDNDYLNALLSASNGVLSWFEDWCEFTAATYSEVFEERDFSYVVLDCAIVAANQDRGDVFESIVQHFLDKGGVAELNETLLCRLLDIEAVFSERPSISSCRQLLQAMLAQDLTLRKQAWKENSSGDGTSEANDLSPELIQAIRQLQPFYDVEQADLAEFALAESIAGRFGLDRTMGITIRKEDGSLRGYLKYEIEPEGSRRFRCSEDEMQSCVRILAENFGLRQLCFADYRIYERFSRFIESDKLNVECVVSAILYTEEAD